MAYHDQDWGVAMHDDRRLFEMLCLEAAQAGLSWIAILRKRLKMAAVKTNALAYLELRSDGSTLDELLWQFTPRGRRKRPRWLSDLPVTTPESDATSKQLKARGFKFVGSTICYALMQAVGIVDDHQQGCWRN